jgi:hypothetical protein
MAVALLHPYKDLTMTETAIPEDIQRLAMAHVAGWGGSASSIGMVAAAMLSERLAQKERDAKIAEGNDHFPEEGDFIASLIRQP